MHERKIWGRYLVEMSGSLFLFVLCLVVSIKVGRHMPEGMMQTMILVSPMLAFLLVVWAVVREIQRNEVMRERKIWTRYMGEMLGAFFLYVLVLMLVHRFGFPMHEGTVRTLVLVSPMGPVLLVVWAIARQIQRVDEYARKQVLETIALAFGITAGWTLSYGFLENAGFPKLSMSTVWPVMGTAWIVVTIIRRITGR